MTEIDDSKTDKEVRKSLLIEVLKSNGDVSEVKEWKVKKISKTFLIIKIDFEDAIELS